MRASGILVPENRVLEGKFGLMSSSGPSETQKPANGFPENSVRDALSRLQNRFHQEAASQLRAGARDGLGQDSNPMADLTRLAVIWRKISPRHDVATGQGDAMPGPAAIALAASRLGLETTCEQRRITALRAEDLPCIVLLEAGGSRLVLGVNPDGGFRIAGGEGDVHVDSHSLAQSANGTIFRVRPAAERAHGDAGAERASPLRGLEEHVAATAHSSPATSPARGMAAYLLAAMRERQSGLNQLILASLLINMFGMTLPLFSMAVFDRVIPHSAMETLWALAIGVAAALILEFGLRHARLKLFDAVGQSTSHALQGQAMGRLLMGKVTALPPRSGGAVQPLQELDSLAMLTPQLLVSLVVDLPFFIFMVVLIATLGGAIAFAPLVGALLLVGLHVLAHRMAHQSALAQGGITRRLQQMAIDTVSAQERLRLTGAAGPMLANWEQAADEGGYASHVSRYWHGLAAQGSAVIIQLVVVTTIVIGVFMIDAAAMTIGALSATILLVNRAMMPVSIATGMGFRMMQMLQASGPLGMILNLELESAGDQRLASDTHVAGQIDLQNVTFKYPGETRAALNGVSLSIKPGERIGIIGKAGCGKSTLLRLIARLQEPQSGKLQLDGRDIRQYDPAMVRRAIGYMPQDAQLIEGTLEENLMLGLNGVPRGLFEQVAGISGVHAFASQNPAGYSLQVGQGGQRLSGGERQCVSLARALMGQPRMLMLDEPTSALDNGLEAKVIADLKAGLGITGLILATHRLPALELVDRIIWIEDGRIAADGPKAEVFQRFGLVQGAQSAKAASA